MTETTLQAVGQFAGDMPLTGYNVQKHSVNVAILRMMPTDTVRSAITHFGTRGLFGKVTRRTAQHDKDNERRKDSRDTQALKSKPNPYPMPVPKRKCRLSRDRSVSKADARGPQPVPGPPGREIVLDFRPHPLPSSCNIAISSSPPAHSARDIPPTANEGRLEHDKAMYARPEALPGLGLAGDTLPTSTNGSSRALSPPSRFFGTSVAYAGPYSALTGFVAYHRPSISSSLQHDAPANQDRRSLNTKPSPPTSTPSGYMVDVPPITQPIVGHTVVPDASTSASAFVGRASSQIYLNSLEAKQPCNALIGDPSVDARTAESLYTRGRPLHQGTLCPILDPGAAPRGAPRSEYPFASFAHPDSQSNRVPPLSNHFAGPGGAHTWHGSQATTDPCAHENGTALAPCYAMPIPIHTHASSNQHNTPPSYGYSASMWSSASREREGPVAPPPTPYYYSLDPALWSRAAASNVHPLSDGTLAHASMIQSDEAVNTLVNFYAQSLSAPYVDSGLQPAYPVGSHGLICSSMRAPEIAWQMTPESRVACTDGQTANAFMGVGANAGCQCAECVPCEAHYAQGFEGRFNAYDSSWVPTIPRPDHVYLDSVRGGRWDWHDGAYPNAPSSDFAPAYPLSRVGRDHS